MDRLRADIQALTGKRAVVNIREVPNPDASAQLIADVLGAKVYVNQHTWR